MFDSWGFGGGVGGGVVNGEEDGLEVEGGGGSCFELCCVDGVYGYNGGFDIDCVDGVGVSVLGEWVGEDGLGGEFVVEDVV